MLRRKKKGKRDEGEMNEEFEVRESSLSYVIGIDE
jgi:hypothetical protein